MSFVFVKCFNFLCSFSCLLCVLFCVRVLCCFFFVLWISPSFRFFGGGRIHVYLWLRVCVWACFCCFGMFLLCSMYIHFLSLRGILGGMFFIYLVSVSAFGFDFVCSCVFVCVAFVFVFGFWRLWYGLCFCQMFQFLVFVFVSPVVSVFFCVRVLCFLGGMD